MDWKQLTVAIKISTGKTLHFSNKQPVGGGCINQAWKAEDQSGKVWFIKSNSAHLLFMFEAEAQGLQEIIDTNSIHAPKPLCSVIHDNHSYLIMEYISLGRSPSDRLLGRQIATMHQYLAPEFGWKQDNTIGSTLQSNTLHSNWLKFWRYERLEFQFNLALKNGITHQIFDSGMQLAANLHNFFTHYQPSPSLLHGDLWGGNYSADNKGNPVIYDPAVYYGDHETDLAMMELFGRPSPSFFSAYNEYFPIDPDYTTRKTLYNLYHILNHFNLFGGGYASQAQSMINKLLAEI